MIEKMKIVFGSNKKAVQLFSQIYPKLLNINVKIFPFLNKILTDSIEMH